MVSGRSARRYARLGAHTRSGTPGAEPLGAAPNETARRLASAASQRSPPLGCRVAAWSVETLLDQRRQPRTDGRRVCVSARDEYPRAIAWAAGVVDAAPQSGNRTAVEVFL